MFLELENLQIGFTNAPVVDNLNLQLQAQEIGCLLGPSGCGKSTVLRAIAGLQTIKQGQIRLDGRVISSQDYTLSPEKRNVGMVFQDFALFPHMTVEDNIAFGLRKWSSKAQKMRIDELLQMVGLQDFRRRYPYSMSGGEQQRVALARALAPRPSLLLLDEPLSSLDYELRHELANDLREILLQEKIAAIFVTHDQMEAFAVADRVGVMNEGHIHQFACSYDIYHEPNTRFVAEFVGHGVFIKATIIDAFTVECALGRLTSSEAHGRQAGQVCELLVRPDDVIHDDDSAVKASVQRKMFRGSHFLYKVVLDDQQKIFCLASSHHNHPVGDAIGIRPEVDHLVLF